MQVKFSNALASIDNFPAAAISNASFISAVVLPAKWRRMNERSNAFSSCVGKFFALIPTTAMQYLIASDNVSSEAILIAFALSAIDSKLPSTEGVRTVGACPPT